MLAIIAGLEKAFPETGIDTEANIDTKVNLQKISSKIAPFIRTMMDSGEYEEGDHGQAEKLVLSVIYYLSLTEVRGNVTIQYIR